MKIPLLSEVYPVTETFAELYGGSTEGTMFKRTFRADTLEMQIDMVNAFLQEQGFNYIVLHYDAFEDKKVYEEGQFSFAKDVTGYNQIMLIYHQPVGIRTMDEILNFLNFFRGQRDWKKFHTSKNLAMAVGSEAGELMDLFLWDRDKDVDSEKVEKELADILIYCLYIADNWKIDLLDAVIKKTIENDSKYPVDKAKGTAKKSTDL